MGPVHKFLCFAFILGVVLLPLGCGETEYPLDPEPEDELLCGSEDGTTYYVRLDGGDEIRSHDVPGHQ